VIDNHLITKPFSSKDRVACRWVNMKLSCNAGISIGDFRAVTANHHRQTGAFQTANAGVHGSPPNDLSSHDGHRDATLVFFFPAAATLAFFLSVTATFVGFLALLMCCT
jgi:hypothetical protein